MSLVDIPNEMKIFQIAYLTMKGWKLGLDALWSRDGCFRELSWEDKDANRRFPGMYDDKKFDLSQAWDHQSALEAENE